MHIKAHILPLLGTFCLYDPVAPLLSPLAGPTLALFNNIPIPLD